MLRIVFFAFLAILLRVWHLEVVQRDKKLEESQKPQRKTFVLKADRGAILDRFQIPLAVNKIRYNATIHYNQIAELPSSAWREEGALKPVRYYPRREYIQQLSEKLGSLLHLEPDRIEDLIHAKAALFPHVPYLLKSHLTEEEYYQLAFLEKEYPGVHAEISSERFYPKGKAGSELIGRVGPISSKEYQELKEKAYTIQDLVGKTGMEKKFEERLRGVYGKKICEMDPKGKCREPQAQRIEAASGENVELALSIELQEFAEALLAENEAEREGRSLRLDPETKEKKPLKQPWIKGGAIVVMDPNTGEVLAMASTPRFDPNDFISPSRKKNISRWLENERYIGAIWDGLESLRRERFSPKTGFYEELRLLSWDVFLDTILAPDSSLKTFFLRVGDVKTAIRIQEDFEALLYHCNLRDPAELFEKLYSRHEEIGMSKWLDGLLAPIGSNADRLFALDLLRLVVHAPALTDESIQILGPMKLHQYRALNQEACRLEEALKETARIQFHKEEFAAWRAVHQKQFLEKCRADEKQKRSASRPFTDHLDEKERELFAAAWKERRLDALVTATLEQGPASPLFQLCRPLSRNAALSIFHAFRSFDDLNLPLLGSYRRLRNAHGKQTSKDLASAFYPIGGFGYNRSYAFQTCAPQGSIFKLVTGFAGLMQTGGENPLSLIDEVKRAGKGHSLIVANSPTGLPYPRMYKGGRLPRSASSHVGKIDLLGAIEQSSNSYFSILAGDVLSHPDDLTHAARLFGFGNPTGIDLFGEKRGNLPNDLTRNRTGLYSTAIGQHTLLTTPLQTAVMLSAIANGGALLKPHLLQQKTEIVQQIAFPPTWRAQLLSAMERVLWSSKGNARPGLIRSLIASPPLLKQYLLLRHQMVGKTSTAEILFNPSLNPSSTPSLYNHIWFGAISFKGDSQWDEPELVVVIQLRYGGAGRDAAPLAAQVIQKWREIRAARVNN